MLRGVHILTGHTHYTHNTVYSESIMEHNTTAICATWWWTGYYGNGHISRDGTPGGYGVYEIDGTQIEWHYKGLGLPREKQFITYDMNTVKNYFRTNQMAVRFLKAYPTRDDYKDVGSNVVYINVWNWDSQWTLRVTENGRELPVERVWHRDPLHTICLDYARILNGLDPVNDWESLRHSHMFRVVASSPRTSLHVEATDRFGRRYEETMRRPKEFTADMN